MKKGKAAHKQKTSKKAGLPPGALVYLGEEKKEPVTLSAMDYTAGAVNEKSGLTLDECLAMARQDSVTWITVSGVHDISIVQDLGSRFSIHPLVLEDIVHTSQRPKFEEYEDHIFVSMRMLNVLEDGQELMDEQVSLIINPGYVLFFHEGQENVFAPLRERIRSARGRIRKMGGDYLGYAIMDSVVDGYFSVLEHMSDRLEELQEEVLDDPDVETLHEIQVMKRKVLSIRKAVWPLREVISRLSRGDAPLITREVEIFFQDVHDHAVQVVDTVEGFRDILTGLLDIYLSSVSNRMNEVMKVLTIVGAIFIPITFLAGVYGMNFEHIPELKWRFGYLAFWGLAMGVVIVLVTFFRKKKWL